VTMVDVDSSSLQVGSQASWLAWTEGWWPFSVDSAIILSME